MSENEMRRQKISWFVSSAVFACIVLALIIGLGKIMQDKTSKHLVTPLYDEEAQYDVVLLGTSHVLSGLYPMIMWENSGIAACNYAQVGQVFPLTYYSAKEAIDVVEPEMIVCDLYYIYKEGKASDNMPYKHQTLDNMRFFSPNRIEAIMDVIVKEDRSDFLFPFFAYHSRWNDLAKRDFEGTVSYTKGSEEKFSRAEEPFAQPFVPVAQSEMKRPSDEVIEYIDKLIALCEETETKLLFTVVPYYPMGEQQGRILEDDQRLFNWVGNYVEQQGIECLNMLYLIDEMGFDMDEHMREWNHQNYWGGTVTSTYLAEYIQQNYGIADHRGEAGYEQWDADLADYTNWCEGQLKKAK